VRQSSEKLTDKLEPTVDLRTAEAANEILENQSFTRVFDRLRSEALADFTSSDPTSPWALQEIRQRIAALDKIKASIQSLADELKLHHRKRQEEPAAWN
jgi:hypothetical protein